jgi:hypothetical protein
MGGSELRLRTYLHLVVIAGNRSSKLKVKIGEFVVISTHTSVYAMTPNMAITTPITFRLQGGMRMVCVMRELSFIVVWCGLVWFGVVWDLALKLMQSCDTVRGRYAVCDVVCKCVMWRAMCDLRTSLCINCISEK